MQAGHHYLTDCNKLTLNAFSPLTAELIQLHSTSPTILRSRYILEVFICGSKFFNFFSTRDSGVKSLEIFSEAERIDWLNLRQLFLNAVEETQELHQTLHMRLIFKSFRCLGINGDTRANDIMLFFHELKPKERARGVPLKLDDKFTISERSVESFKDHVCPDQFHFGGTAYQVTSYYVYCLKLQIH
jgi:hypothetical protein